MAVVSMPANQQQQNSTEVPQQQNSHESRFSHSSSGGARRSAAGSSRRNTVEIVEEEQGEIVEEEQEPFGPLPEKENSILSYDMEEKTFVAVGKEFKESISSLVWTLRTCPTLKKLVIVHVHRPSQWIPMMGGKFLASQLESQQVNAYRQQEKQKLDKILDEYESFCKCSKVQVEKLLIEMDDVAKGLVELITQNGITKLVMGAAANKHYSKKMKAPKSKTACTVEKEAPPSCKIWFVCKENLICTREANSDGYEVTVSPRESSSSRSSLSDTPSVSQLCHLSDGSQDLKQSSGSYNACSWMEVDTLPVVGHVGTSTSQSRLNADEFHSEIWEGTPTSGGSEWSLLPRRKEEISLGLNSTDGSIIVQHPRDDLPLSSTQEQLEGLTLNYDLYHKLEEAIGEVVDSKDEAYAESCRRRKAERELVVAKRKAKALKTRYAKDMKLRKEIEEELEREKLEIERLISQRDEVFDELQTAQRQKAMLESQIIESDCAAKDLEEKLLAARYLLNSLKAERDRLLWERNDAIREVNELRQMKEEVNGSSCRSSNFSQFTALELEQATHKFESSLVIGEGGYGRVYKGYIRHTPVAIKILHPESLQGQSEFYQEVDILSRVRHPNLVTLVGACSESRALVYEFLPNGSLEDHLICKNGTPALPWRVRTRIAYEVCCALVFLHLAKPSTIVHGDLKPANILLDANLVSKLGDFGISRLISASATTTIPYCHTVPKGTAVYMDPEFLSTRDLTPRSDVYSFGFVLLRLLTGKPALGIVKEVREAVDKGKLQDVLDPTAGDWPLQHAHQLADLGIRCCEVNRKNRPDLINEVWRLEQMKDGQISFRSLSLLGSSKENRTGVPSYFICPISQEIMKDPCVAADGYTYEAEAIRKWLESGKKMSPKTKLRLSHNLLTPNCVLRTAIQDWLQHQA